ncbi:hypothetical protein J8281_08065 [Aquimarina sp. U1-2]|uniref:hypothetical protein n=1 Tax=Aquimarina sp. U1-2 TaxID=2823141 RepID=UPI001AED0123|nr:hypothetical protein [Aquimarina sp. U1-2]MBP2832142.1 hypothetical protein [Aquimarina sp. U1-2]
MKYFFLLLSLTIFSCFAQKKDCNKFKTGTFKYSDNDDWVVTRTDSTQIEVNKKNGRTLRSSINWLSNCEYVATVKDVNSSVNDIIGKVIKVNITQTDKDTYIVYATSDEESYKVKMIKIKNTKNLPNKKMPE